MLVKTKEGQVFHKDLQIQIQKIYKDNKPNAQASPFIYLNKALPSI